MKRGWRTRLLALLTVVASLLCPRISYAAWGENWGTMIWGTGLGTGIPTLTTWGLVVLTIAMLTTGVIILIRRRHLEL